MLSFKEIKVSSQHLCSRTAVTKQFYLARTRRDGAGARRSGDSAD